MDELAQCPSYVFQGRVGTIEQGKVKSKAVKYMFMLWDGQTIAVATLGNTNLPGKPRSVLDKVGPLCITCVNARKNVRH